MRSEPKAVRFFLLGALLACSANPPTTTGSASGGAFAAMAGNFGMAGAMTAAAGGALGAGGARATDLGGSGGGGGAAGTSGVLEAGQAGNAGAAGGSKGSGCMNAGLLFCDDFEDGTTVGLAPPAPKWATALNGNGTVTVDDQVPAHSGSRSVHISSAGGYQTFLVLSGPPVFQASPGALYLRLYVRLAAAMTAGHNTYYKAGAAGAASSDHETRVGVMNGMLMINQPAGDRGFLSNQNYYSDGNKPGVVITPLSWTCIEALFDPPHSTFDIWVNGTEVPDLHRTDWQQDALGSFQIGFEKYAGPDAELWYDDIAVSAQPIGCD